VAELWLVLLIAAAIALLAGAVVALVLSNRKASKQLRFIEQRLSHQVVHDECTGLLNEAGVTLVGAQIVNIAQRDSDPVTACIIKVHPREGLATDPHEDDLLAVAEAAVEVFRAGDAISRVNTDTVLMVGKGMLLSADEVERRLVGKMARMVPEGDPVPAIMVGCGMIAPWENADLPSLVDRARTNLQSRVNGS